MSRPRYLQVLVVLAVLLVTAAAICTVLMRPVSVLIVNTGGLILGVWGIRTLLLGSLPADATLVDIALTSVIFAQLTAVTVRVLTYLHARGDVRLNPWGTRREAAERGGAGIAGPAAPAGGGGGRKHWPPRPIAGRARSRVPARRRAAGARRAIGR